MDSTKVGESFLNDTRITKSSRFERNSREALLSALTDFIKLEKEVEQQKVDLSILEDFNLIDAFGLLDINGKGYVTATELREALLDLGLRCNIDETHLILKRYSSIGDGKLKYSDFTDAFMP